jgi:hypothetical protein
MTQRRKNKNTNKSQKKKKSSMKNKKHGGLFWENMCTTDGKDGRTETDMNFQSSATPYQECQINKVIDYLNEYDVAKSWEHFKKLRETKHFHGKDGERIGDYSNIYDVDRIAEDDITAMVNHIKANTDTTTDDGKGNISTSKNSSANIGDGAPKFIPIFDQLTKDKDAIEQKRIPDADAAPNAAPNAEADAEADAAPNAEADAESEAADEADTETDAEADADPNAATDAVDAATDAATEAPTVTDPTVTPGGGARKNKTKKKKKYSGGFNWNFGLGGVADFRSIGACSRYNDENEDDNDETRYMECLGSKFIKRYFKEKDYDSAKDKMNKLITETKFFNKFKGKDGWKKGMGTYFGNAKYFDKEKGKFTKLPTEKDKKFVKILSQMGLELKPKGGSSKKNKRSMKSKHSVK